jgi:hypothetical protein
MLSVVTNFDMSNFNINVIHDMQILELVDVNAKDTIANCY